jgi:hypothetical protein
MEILEPSTDNVSTNRRNLYILEEKERKRGMLQATKKPIDKDIWTGSESMYGAKDTRPRK